MNRVLSVAALAIACSIAYYFVIALPKIEKDKLEFEREKIAAAEAQREELKSQKEERKRELLNCRVDVEKSRNEYMKLNGKEVPDKPGIYLLSNADIERMAVIERDGYADCARHYEGQ
jgi:hypothetical protein